MRGCFYVQAAGAVRMDSDQFWPGSTGWHAPGIGFFWKFAGNSLDSRRLLGDV